MEPPGAPAGTGPTPGGLPGNALVGGLQQGSLSNTSTGTAPTLPGRQQARVAAIRELAATLARETEGSDVNATAVRMALVQICGLLDGLDEATLREQLQGDLRQYVGLLNALARLSREGGGLLSRDGKKADDGKGTDGLANETLETIQRQLRLL